MDRRRSSLVLLLLFVACTGVAIVVGGSRPGLQQGVAPTVVQFVGYLLALVAGVLLLPRPATGPGEDRRIGALVLGGLAVLLAMEVVLQGGTDIGAGAVRLVGLVVVCVATARLARGVAGARPGR
jgi:peptidoglycan/LPS O-acetylase OafA/YrhL